MARPDPLGRLVEQLQRLPGIGAKSAQRLAFHILKAPPRGCRSPRPTRCARSRTRSPTARSAATSPTPIPAYFCTDGARDPRMICVVEEPENVNGGGEDARFQRPVPRADGRAVAAPGRRPRRPQDPGPADARRRPAAVEEVILATNPNVEGEATAIYLAKLLKPLGVRVTRIAMGVPVGSDLEYADEVTMGKAMEGRARALTIKPGQPRRRLPSRCRSFSTS